MMHRILDRRVHGEQPVCPECCRMDPPGHEARIRWHAERVEREEPPEERAVTDQRHRVAGYRRKACRTPGCGRLQQSGGQCDRCYNRERKRRLKAG